jgi:hypothetical protein
MLFPFSASRSTEVHSFDSYLARECLGASSQCEIFGCQYAVVAPRDVEEREAASVDG